MKSPVHGARAENSCLAACPSTHGPLLLCTAAAAGPSARHAFVGSAGQQQGRGARDDSAHWQSANGSRPLDRGRGKASLGGGLGPAGKVSEDRICAGLGRGNRQKGREGRRGSRQKGGRRGSRQKDGRRC
eukprot:10462406-Alexandrium_andersonii.AAC.1